MGLSAAASSLGDGDRNDHGKPTGRRTSGRLRRTEIATSRMATTSGAESDPESRVPHLRHAVGLSVFVSSRSAVGINARSCLRLPSLPAPLPLRSLRSRRKRVLAAWRQGRVVRCLRALVRLQSLLELSNCCQQKPRHCLGVWRPLRNLLCGDLQRGTPFLWLQSALEKRPISQHLAPRGVNGYGCRRCEFVRLTRAGGFYDDLLSPSLREERKAIRTRNGLVDIFGQFCGDGFRLAEAGESAGRAGS